MIRLSTLWNVYNISPPEAASCAFTHNTEAENITLTSVLHVGSLLSLILLCNAGPHLLGDEAPPSSGSAALLGWDASGHAIFMANNRLPEERHATETKLCSPREQEARYIGPVWRSYCAGPMYLASSSLGEYRLVPVADLRATITEPTFEQVASDDQERVSTPFCHMISRPGLSHV